LVGTLRWNHQIALDKKKGKKGDDAEPVESKPRINANDYPMVGKHCTTQAEEDEAIIMAYVAEGWYRFLLLYGCGNIYPTDAADSSIENWPGAVNSTLNQFARPTGDDADPNWVAVAKKQCTRHNNVRHIRGCFFFGTTMLSGTCTLPYGEEKVAYGYDRDKFKNKRNGNTTANETKKKNFLDIEKKVRYNIKLLHKATMACEYKFVQCFSPFLFICDFN